MKMSERTSIFCLVTQNFPDFFFFSFACPVYCGIIIYSLLFGMRVAMVYGERGKMCEMVWVILNQCFSPSSLMGDPYIINVAACIFFLFFFFRYFY